MHVSSLPSGDLGPDAYRYLDFLKSIDFSIWQTLPLNMTHDDGSPYQCLSAHAGNPNFISLTQIVQDGWLSQKDLLETNLTRNDLFKKAFNNFRKKKSSFREFEAFCEKTKWLDDFSMFLVIRGIFKQTSWNEWPEAYKNRDIETLNVIRNVHESELSNIKFTQFLFFKQWHDIKSYANGKNIYLFGDIPIFVAYDSADVWAQPEIFKLDANKEMTVVAGVPPDYFSETGQRWGNPHYNWEAMESDGFAWWLDRMETQHALFDLVRIDHFRGLEAAWEIPSSESTAINGEWVLAPGEALLTAISNRFPDIALVAEDLGIITDEVNALREKFLLPGMKILQFAFDGSEDNPYLPERITKNSVVYTGTHDNDTTLGWYEGLSTEQRKPLHDYLKSDQPDMPFELVELALSTTANLVVIPMQDLLELDSDCRMNVPGTISGNWKWRFDWEQMSNISWQRIKDSVVQSERN